MPFGARLTSVALTSVALTSVALAAWDCPMSQLCQSKQEASV